MAESAPAPDLAQLVAAFAIMEKAGRARRLMSASVFFQGKKITQAERALLAKAFGETIDDMHVCHTVLIRAMRENKALERGAITRALRGETVGYTDGGRAVKRLIRQVRHDLKYRDPLGTRLLYAFDQIFAFPYLKVLRYVAHLILNMIRVRS